MSYTTQTLKQYLERFAHQHGLTTREVSAEIECLCAEYTQQLAQMSQRLDTLRGQLAQAHVQPCAPGTSVLR
jgi:tryptophan synthase beta subunit